MIENKLKNPIKSILMKQALLAGRLEEKFYMVYCSVLQCSVSLMG